MANLKFSKSLIIVSLIIGLILSAGYLITKGVSEDVKQSIIAREQIQLEHLKEKINEQFSKYDAVAYSIAKSPRITDFLLNNNNVNYELTNETIDRYNFAFNASVIYILDTNGNCIASSNRYNQDSFLGQNYSFRAYFNQAMIGEQGVLITIGLTSNKRGYYTSYPIRDRKSKIIGVLAVKVDLDTLEKQFKFPNVLFIDPNDIVFLSSNKSLNFKLVSDVDSNKLDSLKSINIYGITKFDFIWNTKPKSNEVINYEGTEYIYLSANVNLKNWKIATLVEVDKVSSTITEGMLIATIICFIIIAIYRIIDNYYKANKKSKQREEELSYLIDFLPDGAFAINNKNEIIAWNREYENLSGVKAKDIIGKSNYEYSIPFYGERKPVLIDYVNRTADEIKLAYPNYSVQENTLIAESEVLLPSGKKAILWVKAGNVYNINGDIIGAIEVVRDITRIKKYENEIIELLNKLTISNNSLEENISQKDSLILELNQANDKLKIINAEKDKFFSVISHDLRSPLSGFLSLSEMIIEENMKLSKNQIVDYVNTLYHSANQLYELLENLLEWSRIQLGNVRYNPQLINVKSIVQSNIELISTKVDSKSIAIYNMVDANLELNTDTNMLNAIFRNLISNAVKFTKTDGAIFIRSAKNEQGGIALKIQDTGIGMNKELMDKLFVIGENTSRLGTEGEASSGLGLMLCKEYSDRISAKLTIESEVNKGSTFILEFDN